jgi:protein ImuB
MALVPAHGVRLGASPGPAAADADRPWPGHVPAPSPAIVHGDDGPTVDLLDAAGEAVRVSGRGLLVGTPARCGPHDVAAWAGPWPCEERWWDPAAARRQARLQVVLGSGSALLLSLRGGRWQVEATYD